MSWKYFNRILQSMAVGGMFAIAIGAQGLLCNQQCNGKDDEAKIEATPSQSLARSAAEGYKKILKAAPKDVRRVAKQVVDTTLEHLLDIGTSSKPKDNSLLSMLAKLPRQAADAPYSPKDYLLSEMGPAFELRMALSHIEDSTADSIDKKCNAKYTLGCTHPNNMERTAYFDLIRHPTKRNLELMYRFARKMPQFIVDSLLHSTAGDFRKANMIFKAEMSRGTPLTLYGEDMPVDEDTPPDKDAPLVKVAVKRDEYGELVDKHGDRIGDRIPTVKLPGLYERTLSPFAKFLYRRGPLFTIKLQSLMRAYTRSSSEKEFMQMTENLVRR
jgi:hypothetical protein